MPKAQPTLLPEDCRCMSGLLRWLGAAPTEAPPPVSWDWLIPHSMQAPVRMFFVLFHFLIFFGDNMYTTESSLFK